MSIITEAYLFEGVGKTTLEQVREIAERKTHPTGVFLFRAGDSAAHLYLLEEGRVRLRAGGNGQVAYVLSQPGEVFGWSSMVAHPEYALSAECVGPVNVCRFEKKALLRLLEKDPPSGFIFFRHLSELIGERLAKAYQATISVHGERAAQSYG